MKLKTQEKYLDIYFPCIEELIKADKDQDARGLMRVMMKEIERDTRYAACDEVNRLNQMIHNISI